MRRIFAVSLVACLALAPAAAAKGPHAILSSGMGAAVPGKPWEARLELNEFRRVQRPVLTATRGDRQVAAQVRKVAPRVDRRTGFATRLVFPTRGAWRLTLVVGKRSFAFPTIRVGSGDVPEDYVAFPAGSEAAAQGAGGVYLDDGGALPPENLSIVAADAEVEEGGGGIKPWLFPLLGVVLAGAGVATLRARR
jgi:hypothetical protein